MLTIAHIRAIISEKREEVFFMFDNPGDKIKKLATVLFWVSVVGVVCYAISFLIAGNFLLFLVCIIAGPLAAYGNMLLVAGFGELVENSNKTYLTNQLDKIYRNTVSLNASNSSSAPSYSRPSQSSFERQQIERMAENAREEAGASDSGVDYRPDMNDKYGI
jgi:hypothetical protein